MSEMVRVRRPCNGRDSTDTFLLFSHFFRETELEQWSLRVTGPFLETERLSVPPMDILELVSRGSLDGGAQYTTRRRICLPLSLSDRLSLHLIVEEVYLTHSAGANPYTTGLGLQQVVKNALRD